MTNPPISLFSCWGIIFYIFAITKCHEYPCTQNAFLFLNNIVVVNILDLFIIHRSKLTCTRSLKAIGETGNWITQFTLV